jgi:hypothetical protein
MNKKNKKAPKEEQPKPVIDEKDLKSELESYLKNTEKLNKLDSFENERIKQENADNANKIEKLKKLKEEGNIDELNNFCFEIVLHTNIA